jgi:hypothetical protein
MTTISMRYTRATHVSFHADVWLRYIAAIDKGFIIRSLMHSFAHAAQITAICEGVLTG